MRISIPSVIFFLGINLTGIKDTYDNWCKGIFRGNWHVCLWTGQRTGKALLFLGVTVGVSLEDIGMHVNGEDPSSVRAGTIQLSVAPNRTKRDRKDNFFSHPCSWNWDTLLLAWDIRTPGFPAFRFWDLNQRSPVSQAFSLSLKITLSASIILRLFDFNWIMLPIS